MDSPILALVGVDKIYRTRKSGRTHQVHAVRNVSFEIPPHHIVALVGESGSGKSTIAKLIVGIERADAGQILFLGRPFTEWRRQIKDYRRRVQMVFQDPYAALNPLSTVRYALSRPLVNYRQLKGEELEREIERILMTVHLTPVKEFIDKLPFELSGGQMQRVVTARALASSPELIVADEPVSMLDVSIRAEILRLLDELRHQAGVSILYITHDLISARMLADEIVVLFRGTVVEKGDAKEVAKHPKHPYTELLLQSIPNPWAEEEAVGVDLSVMDRTSDAGGCVFRARCPYAMPVCHTTVPVLQPVDPHRSVACFKYDAERASQAAN
jgi:peptide/nickel transport system ATP-binding protein